MKIGLDGSELCLFENQPLRLEKAQGCLVQCTSGTLWITSVGNPEDIFLHTGDCYRINDDSLTLIEGAAYGQIRLYTPEAIQENSLAA